MGYDFLPFINTRNLNAIDKFAQRPFFRQPEKKEKHPLLESNRVVRWVSKTQQHSHGQETKPQACRESITALWATHPEKTASKMKAGERRLHRTKTQHTSVRRNTKRSTSGRKMVLDVSTVLQEEMSVWGGESEWMLFKITLIVVVGLKM